MTSEIVSKGIILKSKIHEMILIISLINIGCCIRPGDTYHRRNEDTGSFYFNSPKSRYLSGKAGFEDEYYGSGRSNAMHSYESNIKNHRNYFLNHRNVDRKTHDNNPSEYESEDLEQADLTNRAMTNRQMSMLDKDMNHIQRPSMGNENMIFTHLTKEAGLENYKKELKNSKVFMFTAYFDFMANFNLLSTTKGYHPQLVLSETKDEISFKKIQGDNEYGNYSSKYSLLKDHTYVVEIGTIGNMYTGQFIHIDQGGFVAIFSSNAKSLLELMSSERIQVGSEGFKGRLVFNNGEVLNLNKSKGFGVSYGRLNYEITPYYDKNQNIISLYYIDGSNEQKGRKNRSSTVEIKAVEMIRDCGTPNCRIYYGKEHRDAEYNFLVESRMVNELTSLIK